MRVWRLVAIGWSVALALFTGTWSAHSAGAQSPSRQTWCLSFHEVHPVLTPRDALQQGIPAGYKIYPSVESSVGEQLLRENPVVHGGEVADAKVAFDARTSQPVISFRLDANGGHKFGSFTASNIGRPFAIVVDGRVESAPMILEPILGGAGQISGSFTVAQARELAARIRSGTCRPISRGRFMTHAARS